LRTTYPEHIGETGLDIFHLSEFLSQSDPLPISENQNESRNGKVTYQDPCRLGRYAGVYQQPRDLIANLGFELMEMDHNRQTSICCGTSCWSSCGQVNKNIQSSRLEEASNTGAEMLVTACFKCQIHLQCALKAPGNNDQSQLTIRDLTTLLAERI
jgi:Fe-S oxidoreductase